MSKPNGSQRVKAPPKASPAAAERLLAGEPNPPKRRPVFLWASAVAMALWLAFLLWMAIR